MKEMSAAIQLLQVSKVYSERSAQAVRALDGIELNVGKGEFVALKGSSGSGKTTLLNIASGLDHPSEGRVVLDGEEITGKSVKELTEFRSRRIGFVFQSYNLFKDLTVIENVEFTSILRGDDPVDARKRAERALGDVGLATKLHHFPKLLSGGQQQRVAVARAIAMNPAMIFADEPTANLDSKTAIDLIELFEEMNRKTGITFLFSTHDPQLLGRVRRIVEIRDGRILSDRAPA
jgi:putative ABC transport system ATP-binding protein